MMANRRPASRARLGTRGGFVATVAAASAAGALVLAACAGTTRSDEPSRAASVPAAGAMPAADVVAPAVVSPAEVVSPAVASPAVVDAPATTVAAVAPGGAGERLADVGATAWTGMLPEGALAVPAHRVAPTRLRIPSLGMDAVVQPVGVTADGALALPADTMTVAWYAGGPAPGESGSAVLAAHVDYQGAEGVFFRLASLKSGADVHIDRSDGSTVTFQSMGAGAFYSKSSLPLDQLFRRGAAPALTLVTFGGVFDPVARSYDDNVVVSAVPQHQPTDARAARA